MNDQKTFYYSDELHDEFSGISRNTKEISDDYCYIRRNPLWRGLSVVVHRIIMTPFSYLYCKLVFDVRYVNRKALKPYRKQGYFLYGNHTQVPGDGLLQALAVFPAKSYVVVNADNVSAKGTENFMLMLGALPLPSSMGGYRNFLSALKTRLAEGHPIVIYPEAHIWPYYTKIRPFTDTSFAYPVAENRPAFAMTVTYSKRGKRRRPAMTVYLDGPFFPEGGNRKEKIRSLRDQIYETMCRRSTEYSTYEYYHYIKREKCPGRIHD